MLRLIILALGVAFIGLPTGPASAEQVCGERTKLMASLGKKFAEAPVAMGLTSSGTVIEVLTSPSGSLMWRLSCAAISGMCAGGIGICSYSGQGETA